MKAICTTCGARLTNEERLVNAIFGDSICRKCSDNQQAPKIMVNGMPLDEYLEKEGEENGHIRREETTDGRRSLTSRECYLS